MANMFDGQVAIVTGASSRIGKATALAFARAGAKLVLASRNCERGEMAAHQVVQSGAEAIFVSTDVSKPDDVRAMVETATGHFGRVDYAFNNAGTGGSGGLITECTEEGWDRVMGVYLYE